MVDEFDSVVARLFDASSEIPEEERADWLDAHCENDAQRQRVEVLLRLLDVHETAVDDVHVAGMRVTDGAAAMPERLGGYRITPAASGSGTPATGPGWRRCTVTPTTSGRSRA